VVDAVREVHLLCSRRDGRWWRPVGCVFECWAGNKYILVDTLEAGLSRIGTPRWCKGATPQCYEAGFMLLDGITTCDTGSRLCARSSVTRSYAQMITHVLAQAHIPSYAGRRGAEACLTVRSTRVQIIALLPPYVPRVWMFAGAWDPLA
jgi:hypothetical protein